MALSVKWVSVFIYCSQGFRTKSKSSCIVHCNTKETCAGSLLIVFDHKT